MFLPSLFSPGGGWAKKIAGLFVDLSTLGTIDRQIFAPATGYISLFTLALYILGLVLLTPSPEPEQQDARALLRAYENLPALERMAVREAIAGAPPAAAIQSSEALKRLDTVEVTGELVTDAASEETLVRPNPNEVR
jgi:hypothetical protein